MPKMNQKCQVCSVDFLAWASSNRKFCSRKCKGIAAAKVYQSKRKKFVCPVCGAEFFEIPSRSTGLRFCSRLCLNRFLAKTYSKARGDALRYSGKGKTYIKQDGRHQHRIIAEQMLGRPLTKEEVVHHKNQNRRDNRPENLQVCASHREHALIHHPKQPPKSCKIEGCRGEHMGLGYCSKHYQRLKKGRPLIQEKDKGK